MDEERIAVALSYQNDKESPEVIAKGKGRLADLILKIAKDHGIPIKEDAKLVKDLYRLEIHKPIPPELYHTVAVVLAWAFKLNKKFREKMLKSLKKTT
ncbi:MAG: EscU/YscU/HrcU family type III secretion system export apparatus switch protein [Caldimicrobium sp.]|nr:EscU/YscU/HrcU family type III secretion system export apparatus switch protein [Caldimicrobium sp.]MCX7613901.1 EscU/YscU/HrcU family type III secretion system export apparatus switch protein [Caldimicrobium sp.]MDW8183451.1 EscU/YscU/HrcU family type III secretion system export apparatus switch protein [Caldimicrobium sp.]